MRILSLISLIFLMQCNTLAQVKWISFDELPKEMRTEAKPILIFIHTDWCKFCAMQENKTFTDSIVVKVISERYYAVKLNAEYKRPISFLGKEYSYKSNGASFGEHELAVLLGKENGVLNFPTTVILSSTWKFIHRKSGFIGVEALSHLLVD